MWNFAMFVDQEKKVLDQQSFHHLLSSVETIRSHVFLQVITFAMLVWQVLCTVTIDQVLHRGQNHQISLS